MQYTHLSYFERHAIYLYRQQSLSRRTIAMKLGRSPATISREIKRNGNKFIYGYHTAQKRATQRRKSIAKSLKMDCPKRIALVEAMMAQLWTPEIIAKRLPAQSKASHQTIYDWIARCPWLKQSLWLGPKGIRKKYGSSDARGTLPNRKSIHDRPKRANKRQRLGDWEGDTVVGAKHKGVIVSMVDRRSRFCMLTLLPNRKSKIVTDTMLARLEKLPKIMRKTITLDNGKEFSEHKRFEKQSKMKAYFADPYASYQRGSNEQLNKLIRRWIPKKTNFHNLSAAQVAEVEKLLNNRPRKCLGYLSPIEFLKKELGAKAKGVALQT